ncbi:hypothetical protein QCA50_007246 [Cerrena zonata]|uniref:DNA replication ATP-dependent helicase/nuclease DNA2 n=1 Tax=Cerrena zonata TaxID=2478898 RepID=A0AAW0GI85_9APHY
MPPKTHSEKEETDFMNGLLSGIDDSFFDAVPSPDPTPQKGRVLGRTTSRLSLLQKTPSKSKTPRKNIATSPLSARKSSCANASNNHVENIEALLEGAESWDWDDMNSDFMTPEANRIQNAMPEKIGSIPLQEGVVVTRCIVKEILESSHSVYYDKILIVQAGPEKETRTVVLRDDWTQTDAQIGDVINVIGVFHDQPSTSSSRSLSIVISAKENLLIHHPDILVTATSLSNAPQCSRRPILSTLVRSSSDVTPALVWGNMLHEVMQMCFSDGNWSETSLDEKIDGVVGKGLEDLLSINVPIDQAKREVKLRARGLKTFSERYIAQEPKPEAILTNTRAPQNQKSLLAISKLHDIEEDIWSPTYGLKGKLDASVQAVISETDTTPNPFTIAARNPHATHTESNTLPFEIKTGRAVAGMEHRAQTMLYTLLMSERYKTEVPSGLLYYTQSEEVIRVPAARNEIRGLVIARNEMASHMMRRGKPRKRKLQPGEDKPSRHLSTPEDDTKEVEFEPEEPFLPPTIDNARICGRCFSLDNCMLYRKAVEEVVDTHSDIADMYALKTSHLTRSQAAFFRKWEALITMEEQDVVRFRKELWTMGAEEREERGKCFASMILDSGYHKDPNTLRVNSNREGKIHQFSYRFIKADTEDTSLLGGHMSIGDAITVSVEPNLLAFAKGFILQLTPREVVVGVDHVIDLDIIRQRVMVSVDPLVFRIDKDELTGGMARIRDNLAQLFYADGDRKRLDLVVDLKPPAFFDFTGPIVPKNEAIAKTIASMNTNQQLAIRKVLSAQDYALILGMPGTGKTTVIAAIIRVLVARGKTVLLTSYTHSAVDTILRKLKPDADFGILRIGNVDKIHPDMRDLTLASLGAATSIEQLEHRVMTPPVVATTCLSIDHALFARRHFDYCIVDEASQVTLPTCLGPLRFASKFVLVGDHFQLPPLVRNRDAASGGMNKSLFRRLSDAHPAAVVDLNEQYRMNEDIMTLSNKLIYSDRLRCGSPEVANQGLRIPDRNYLGKLHLNSPCGRRDCWLDRVMDENCKALFVDTDCVPAFDSRVGDLVQNVIEARLVGQVTEAMLRCGVKQKQIGVITLYRQQIKLLSYLLEDWKDIEILTADRSQGRDKDCIIISMVRSNDLGQIGDLVKDWRRMNVTFTRAKSKLIIFGSRKTLQAAPLLDDFFKLMDNKGWIFTLPQQADQLHEGTRRTPSKRPSDIATLQAYSKENASRPLKKSRKSIVTEESLAKGRHILKDLFNEGK